MHIWSVRAAWLLNKRTFKRIPQIPINLKKTERLRTIDIWTFLKSIWNVVSKYYNLKLLPLFKYLLAEDNLEYIV